jgi:hypothetical protein
MTVSKGRNEITLTCGTCGKQSMSLKKKDVEPADWEENGGWKALRAQAYNANWRISSSESGDHYCPRCIAAYDF